MDLDSLLVAILLLLSATLICVTFFERLGLGAVVGFIVAGILIGPNTPGPVVTDQVQTLQDISQLGVVLFLFVVGLELQPKQLWSMRRELFGVGLLQVLLTSGALTALMISWFHLHWQGALIVGLGLAMSSTAVVMSILARTNQLSTTYGRTSLAVLTAQDMSIVPVMALIPLLAHHAAVAPEGTAWSKLGMAALALVAVVALGRLVLPAALEWAARNRNREAFGIALFLSVFAAAWAMDASGVSMTLGAFLLGMLLSTSEYRYQLVSTVEPLKGPLMGLFFLAVGMAIDVQTLATEWPRVLALIAAVVSVKIVLLLAICRAFGASLSTAVRTAFALSQVGEFAFVLFSAASVAGLVSAKGVSLGFLVIAGSMIVTPLMIRLGDSLARRLHKAPALAPGAYAQDLSRHLVVVGMNNVGHLMALMAERADVPYIAFDWDYQTVMRAKAAGRNVFFGDINTRVVQEAAGLARAGAVLLSSKDIEQLKGISLSLHRKYPALDIYACVNSLEDQFELRERGIKHAGTTFIESTLFRGSSLLKKMGVPEDDVDSLVASLRQDEHTLITQALSGAANLKT